MTDHTNDTITLMVTLDMSDFCRAARLGGLPIALDEQPIDDPDLSDELVRFFAKRGICSAIHDSFDRMYPQHYPDDLEPSFWKMNADPIPVTGGFGYCWRGEVSW